jgi:hypothetical protein
MGPIMRLIHFSAHFLSGDAFQCDRGVCVDHTERIGVPTGAVLGFDGDGRARVG